jgi:V/A-type H+/Na+-transporting ATPase subunit E
MKGLESGKDKVKKICDLLKKETLEPAQHEAQEIIHAARRRAEQMIAEAHQKIDEMQEIAHQEIQQQKAVFEASLAQACRQTLESLREKIENKLFNPELSHFLTKPLQEAKVVAKLIEAVVGAIEKEGLETDLSAAISTAVPAEEVNAILAKKIVERLKEKSVLLSAMDGGAQVKLINQHMTLDLSVAAFKELVAGYIRKDFREMVFGK